MKYRKAHLIIASITMFLICGSASASQLDFSGYCVLEGSGTPIEQPFELKKDTSDRSEARSRFQLKSPGGSIYQVEVTLYSQELGAEVTIGDLTNSTVDVSAGSGPLVGKSSGFFLNLLVEKGTFELRCSGGLL